MIDSTEASGEGGKQLVVVVEVEVIDEAEYLKVANRMMLSEYRGRGVKVCRFRCWAHGWRAELPDFRFLVSLEVVIDHGLSLSVFLSCSEPGMVLQRVPCHRDEWVVINKSMNFL